MTDSHDKARRAGRVSEAAPVQVFLGHEDRERLNRLTAQLDTSKSEVLRRSLAALERDLLDPASHPALRVLGLVTDDAGVSGDDDVAVAHDQYLADVNEASGAPAARRGARRTGRARS